MRQGGGGEGLADQQLFLSCQGKCKQEVSLSLDSFVLFFSPFAGWVDLGRLHCVLFFFCGFPSFCQFKGRGNAAVVTETGSAWQLQFQPGWHLEELWPAVVCV